MALLKEMMIGINTKVNLSGLKTGLSGISSGVSKTVSSATSSFKSLETQIKAANKSMKFMEALAIGAGLGSIVQQAVKFEDHMSGVIKQVNGMRDASGNLTKEYHGMENQIRELAKRSPISQNDIADIVTAGARMNVAKDDLIGFTEVAIKIATAFEVPASEISESMGIVANIFDIPIAKIGEFAGAINYLDDNSIAKGSDIINVLQRIGKAATSLKLKETDVAAWGTTFLSMGKAPEVAASAMNSMLTTLSSLDASKVTKKTGDDFALLGLTTAQVQKGMATDAQKTIDLILDKLSKLEGTKGILAASTIFGKNFGDDINAVSKDMKHYYEYRAAANSEAAKTSLDKEYINRLKTTSAQMEIFKNKSIDVAITLGQALLPPMINLMDKLAPMITQFGEWAKTHGPLIERLAKLSLGLLAAKGALMGLETTVGAFKMIKQLSPLLITAGGAAGTAAGGFRMLGLAISMNPLGLLISGLILVITYWDEISATIKDATDAMVTFYDLGKTKSQPLNEKNLGTEKAVVNDTTARAFSSAAMKEFGYDRTFASHIRKSDADQVNVGNMIKGITPINAVQPFAGAQGTKLNNINIGSIPALQHSQSVRPINNIVMPAMPAQPKQTPANVTINSNVTINQANDPRAVEKVINDRNQYARTLLNGGVAG